MSCKNYYKLFNESCIIEPTGVKRWKEKFPNDLVDWNNKFLHSQYKTRTADCGLQTGLGIKRGLSIKCGLSLKIAVLSHKSKKNATFSVFSIAFELGVFYLQSLVQ